MKLSIYQESSLFSALTKLKITTRAAFFFTNSAKNPLIVIIHLVTVVSPVSRTSARHSVGRGFKTKLKHDFFAIRVWRKYSVA